MRIRTSQRWAQEYLDLALHLEFGPQLALLGAIDPPGHLIKPIVEVVRNIGARFAPWFILKSVEFDIENVFAFELGYTIKIDATRRAIKRLGPV